MAFVRVALIPFRDRAQQSANGLSHTDVYQVIADTPNVRAYEVLAAAADNGHGSTITIPVYGEALGGANTLYATSIQPQRMSDPLEWEVQVTYTPNNPTASQGDGQGLELSFSGIAYTETTTRDKDDNVLLNSAGDVYSPGPEVTRYDELITVSYTTSNIDSAQLASLRGKINDAQVTLTVRNQANPFLPQTRTFADKTLKLLKADIKSTIISGTAALWSVQIELHYRPDTWASKLVDKGYHILNGDGKLVPATDANGNPVTEPVYLDGSGGKLDTSAPPVAAIFYPPNGIYLDHTANLTSFLESI